MFNFILLLLLTSQNLLLPNSGNSYSKTIKLPFIGKQYIETRMTSKNSANIFLKGFLNKNGTALYLRSDKDDFVKISDNLRKTLNNMKINFELPVYDVENDLLMVKLNIKFINYNKTIVLNRMIE